MEKIRGIIKKVIRKTNLDWFIYFAYFILFYIDLLMISLQNQNFFQNQYSSSITSIFIVFMAVLLASGLLATIFSVPLNRIKRLIFQGKGKFENILWYVGSNILGLIMFALLMSSEDFITDKKVGIIGGYVTSVLTFGHPFVVLIFAIFFNPYPITRPIYYKTYLYIKSIVTPLHPKRIKSTFHRMKCRIFFEIKTIHFGFYFGRLLSHIYDKIILGSKMLIIVLTYLFFGFMVLFLVILVYSLFLMPLSNLITKPNSSIKALYSFGQQLISLDISTFTFLFIIISALAVIILITYIFYYILVWIYINNTLKRFTILLLLSLTYGTKGSYWKLKCSLPRTRGKAHQLAVMNANWKNLKYWGPVMELSYFVIAVYFLLKELTKIIGFPETLAIILAPIIAPHLLYAIWIFEDLDIKMVEAEGTASLFGLVNVLKFSRRTLQVGALYSIIIMLGATTTLRPSRIFVGLELPLIEYLTLLLSGGLKLIVWISLLNLGSWYYLKKKVKPHYAKDLRYWKEEIENITHQWAAQFD